MGLDEGRKEAEAEKFIAVSILQSWEGGKLWDSASIGNTPDLWFPTLGNLGVRGLRFPETPVSIACGEGFSGLQSKNTWVACDWEPRLQMNPDSKYIKDERIMSPEMCSEC